MVISVLEALANVNAEMAAAKSVSCTFLGEIARHISLWQIQYRRILGEITEPTDDNDWNTSLFSDETWKQSY